MCKKTQEQDRSQQPLEKFVLNISEEVKDFGLKLEITEEEIPEPTENH